MAHVHFAVSCVPIETMPRQGHGEVSPVGKGEE